MNLTKYITKLGTVSKREDSWDVLIDCLYIYVVFSFEKRLCGQLSFDMVVGKDMHIDCLGVHKLKNDLPNYGIWPIVLFLAWLSAQFCPALAKYKASCKSSVFKFDTGK